MEWGEGRKSNRVAEEHNKRERERERERMLERRVERRSGGESQGERRGRSNRRAIPTTARRLASRRGVARFNQLCENIPDVCRRSH